jgi:hypothetical protein
VGIEPQFLDRSDHNLVTAQTELSLSIFISVYLKQVLFIMLPQRGAYGAVLFLLDLDSPVIEL